MSDHEFTFSLRAQEHARLDDMLRALTASVLRFVGYADGVVSELGNQVRAGVAQGPAGGAGLDLQFRAHAGEIEIIVSRGDRQIFRTSRRLP